MSNFRNWVPELYGSKETTILSLEYWCNDEDADWTAPDADLVALASREMRSTGLLGDALVLDGTVHRIRRCYPVYARGYKDDLAPVVTMRVPDGGVAARNSA